LARDNVTTSDLETAMADLFETLKYNPIPIVGTVVDYSKVKAYIFNTLYYPFEWPQLAALLDTMLTGNLTALAGYLEAMGSGASAFVDESEFGIRCSDKIPRASSWSQLVPTFDQMNQDSRWFGDVAVSVPMTCSQWQFGAKERYLGDFNVQTKNPILLIGNTFDPATPLVSARNMSIGFEGSVVLEHNGYGVSLISPLLSSCTGIHAYCW
jgi:hypothetical protein